MSTILITSDLHLGITTEKELKLFALKVSEVNPDLFVIAGDVGEYGGYFVKCLELLDDVKCGQRAYVAGNHDLWTRQRNIATSKVIWEELIPGLAKEMDWIYLEDNHIIMDGTAVLGSIAWYDYSSAPDFRDVPASHIRVRKHRYNNDGNYMDLDWDDVEFSTACRNRLYYDLKHVDANEDVNGIVVITHVPAFEVQHIHKPYDNAYGTSYFYHYTLGKALLGIDKLHTVISGHTHREMDTTIQRDGKGDIRVAVVPSEYHRPGYITLDL